MPAEPAADGVKLTAHCVGPVAGSAHVPPDPNVPPLSLENESEPDGRVAEPESVSDTLAVHVVCVPIVAAGGAHDRDVDDVRVPPFTPAEPLLDTCASSPP